MSNMTPEQYHLNNIIAVKEKAIDDVTKKGLEADKSRDDDVKRFLIKSGIPKSIVSTAKRHRYDGLKMKIGSVYLTLAACDDFKPSPLTTALIGEVKALASRRTFLCNNTGSAGARKFGAFARTKYGRKLTDSDIIKSHKEWIEVSSSCTC